MLFRKLFAHFMKHAVPHFELPSNDRVQTTMSGLRYEILRPGEGQHPSESSTVTVRYAGWTLDGKLFDSSYPKTATFPLDRVIPGWTEGLQLLAPGGAARLVIPPVLAYGSAGAPPRIGPNATLLFQVELLSFA